MRAPGLTERIVNTIKWFCDCWEYRQHPHYSYAELQEDQLVHQGLVFQTCDQDLPAREHILFYTRLYVLTALGYGPWGPDKPRILNLPSKCPFFLHQLNTNSSYVVLCLQDIEQSCDFRLIWNSKAGYSKSRNIIICKWLRRSFSPNAASRRLSKLAISGWYGIPEQEILEAAICTWNAYQHNLWGLLQLTWLHTPSGNVRDLA